MNIRKILAVILCVAMLFGIGAIAASAASSGADMENPGGLLAGALLNWWVDFYPGFVEWYDGAFSFASDFLVFAFQLLLAVVGLGSWFLP